MEENEENYYAIAAILRKIYDKMPTPLFPYEFYTPLVQEMRSRYQIRFINLDSNQ